MSEQMRNALRTIAEMPIPEQDNMVAANMRAVAVAALATQPQAPQGAEIAQLRELLSDLVECVGRSLADRLHHLDFERYSNHMGFCRRPRGDQSCQCGYSSMRAGLDALLDECTGYQGTAAIDKARAYLANLPAAPETPEGKK